jgi:hypothetical protein
MLALTIFYVVFGTLVLVLVAALVWALRSEVKQSQTPVTAKKTKPERKIYVPQIVIFPSAKSKLNAAKSPLPASDTRRTELQQKLYLLLQGDEHTASRLISSAQARYPGREPIWYLDKVINDLERDRGR